MPTLNFFPVFQVFYITPILKSDSITRSEGNSEGMSLLTPRTPLRTPPGGCQPASTMTPGTPAWPGDPSGAGEAGKTCSSSWAPWLRAGASGSSKVPFGSRLFPPLEAGCLNDDDAAHAKCDQPRGRACSQVVPLTWIREDTLSFA